MQSGWKAEDTENRPGVHGVGRGWWGRGAPQVPTHGEVVGEPLQVDLFVFLQKHADDQPVHLHQGLFSLRWEPPSPWTPGLVTAPLPRALQGLPALPLGRPSRWATPLTRASEGVRRKPAKGKNSGKTGLPDRLMSHVLCTLALSSD